MIASSTARTCRPCYLTTTERALTTVSLYTRELRIQVCVISVIFWDIEHGLISLEMTGLWAIRCGAYKAHYITNTHLNTTAVMHDPPLLFQIERDPSEQYSISSDSDEYKEAMAKITSAKEEHEKSLTQVPNQMAMGSKDEYK